MDNTPKLRLPYIMPAQAQKHVTHNEAIRALDAIVQLSVISRSLTAPPAVPNDGDCYIVGASPTGAWSGAAGQIAAFQDGVWEVYAPRPGWISWVAAEQTHLVWDGAVWRSLSQLSNLAMLGVNTTPDATNRLAAKSDAILLSHDDVTPGTGDIRVIYNKKLTSRTASALFQNNSSGRAEIGLIGDDNLGFKVSADGAAWKNAIIVDRATGVVSMPFTTLAGGREVLTTNRTYFVRADGNNANNGLTNNAGGAFLTIQKAIDTAAALDMSIYDVTIKVADGSYSGANVLKTFLGSGRIIIEGNVTTPANVLINPTGSAFSGTWLGKYVIRGFRLVPSLFAFYILDQGVLEYEAIDFGACSIHVLASGGQITATGNYTISGGASRHWIASGPGARIVCSGKTITITGTPNFTTAFAMAEELGQVRPTANTFSGAATGSRYNATSLGLIQTNGAGVNALPGNSAGSTANGGQYV